MTAAAASLVADVIACRDALPTAAWADALAISFLAAAVSACTSSRMTRRSAFVSAAAVACPLPVLCTKGWIVATSSLYASCSAGPAFGRPWLSFSRAELRLRAACRAPWTGGVGALEGRAGVSPAVVGAGGGGLERLGGGGGWQSGGPLRGGCGSVGLSRW